MKERLIRYNGLKKERFDVIERERVCVCVRERERENERERMREISCYDIF